MTNKATARADKARAEQNKIGEYKMELNLSEFMEFYHDNVPLRVRVWDTDKWEITAEGYVVDGKVVDNNAVLFDNLSALDDYYVATVSGNDLPTADLYPHWNA